MAEFIRKKRFLNYKSKNCKKFISKDFVKQCAYCRIREGDLGGPDSFEIDHFKPQNIGGGDEYDNLYYICTTCNGQAGKSDYWSSTLLDPCEDDIYNVHVELASNYELKEMSPQGKEYVDTFRLNRKSYINRREIIDKHKRDLYKKLKDYEELCEKLGLEEILKEDIIDTKNIIEFGANYRVTINNFDEDIDSMIMQELKTVGDLKEINEDYDLYYQLECNGIEFKCHSMIDEVCFDSQGKCLRYISTKKISIWKEIDKYIPILIIVYNKLDDTIYYVHFSDILANKGIDNESRCGYYIEKSNILSGFITNTTLKRE